MLFHRPYIVRTRNAGRNICNALLRRVKYRAAPSLNVVGEFRTELLRESDRAEFNKVSDWIEFNGIGFAAQTCRFKWNCAAAGEHVQNAGARSPPCNNIIFRNGLFSLVG